MNHDISAVKRFDAFQFLVGVAYLVKILSKATQRIHGHASAKYCTYLSPMLFLYNCRELQAHQTEFQVSSVCQGSLLLSKLPVIHLNKQEILKEQNTYYYQRQRLQISVAN